MASSHTTTKGHDKQAVVEQGVVRFDGTGATYNLPTKLTALYDFNFNRIGTDGGDNAGYVSVNEAETDGVFSLNTAGIVRLVRSKVTGSGTLASEKFTYRLVGKS